MRTRIRVSGNSSTVSQYAMHFPDGLRLVGQLIHSKGSRSALWTGLPVSVNSGWRRCFLRTTLTLVRSTTCAAGAKQHTSVLMLRYTNVSHCHGACVKLPSRCVTEKLSGVHSLLAAAAAALAPSGANCAWLHTRARDYLTAFLTWKKTPCRCSGWAAAETQAEQSHLIIGTAQLRLRAGYADTIGFTALLILQNPHYNVHKQKEVCIRHT